MSFDESLLDDPDALALRDDGRLLWALAGSGAQVRRAVDIADEFDVSRLAGGAVPRALLVAVDSPAKGAGRVLVRLATGVTPTLMWHGVELPRWAGSADALLVASSDGRHPRLARVTEQGAHRGLAVVVVAPEGSPVAEAAGRAPVAHIPGDLNRRALVWAVLTPLLQAAHVLEVASVPASLLALVADALDETAEGCRPSADAFTNPAKALAVEFAEAQPLIAGAGQLAGVAGRLFADALQLFAGAPAIAVTLPDGVAAAGALLVGEPQDSFDDEFFRDRDEEQPIRPRLVTIGDDGEPDDESLGRRSGAQIQLDEVAARRAAEALHQIARQRGLRSSTVDVPAGPPLSRLASATLFGAFVATYLALGRGIDPSEPRPGELAH
ncbi:MAG TPA: SIS domain-containing protein [Jatrophihabitantaceae bacterium]|nr:SIS domain-containing protein [Jatrophihabitantaceae bacterium]